MAEDDLELTVGERLLINRRRLRLSQSEYAQAHGVSRTRYGHMERGNEKPTMPVPEVKDLTPCELFVIKRRREGVTQRELARQMKVSRYWAGQMELGKASSTRLAEFWGGNEG